VNWTGNERKLKPRVDQVGSRVKLDQLVSELSMQLLAL